MKINIFRIILIVLLTIILSSFKFNIDERVLSSLYTVESILFSIIISLTVTFSFENITDIRYLKNLKNRIESVQYTYVAYFIISTILIIFNDFEYSIGYKFLIFNSSAFNVCAIVFTIIFFSCEFINLQKIKYEIIETIIKSSLKK